MNPSLTQQLWNLCPNLYRHKDADISQSLIPFGFPGDGWYNIVHELSVQLEAILVRMPADEQPKYTAEQVKEKFGTLRFYMNCYTQEMYDLISEAEKKSATICEKCGAPGKLRKGGWILTLCDNCANGREA